MTVAFSKGVSLAATMIVVLNFCESAIAGEIRKPIEPRNLPDLIRALPAEFPPIGSKYRLAPEWVGTVTRVYLRGGEGIYKDDKPENMRLTHAWVAKSKEGLASIPDSAYPPEV